MPPSCGAPYSWRSGRTRQAPSLFPLQCTECEGVNSGLIEGTAVKSGKSSRDEVYRAIARNVLFLQKMEGMLKALVMCAHLSMPRESPRKAVADRKKAVAKTPMGRLVNELLTPSVRPTARHSICRKSLRLRCTQLTSHLKTIVSLMILRSSCVRSLRSGTT